MGVKEESQAGYYYVSRGYAHVPTDLLIFPIASYLSLRQMQQVYNYVISFFLMGNNFKTN